MSQAKAKSNQMVKSLNFLYKVCSSTNTSRSCYSDSSFKAHSFAKKFSTLNSVATYKIFDLQNPNQFPGTGKSSSGFGQDWCFRESNSRYGRNPNGLFRETSMGFQRTFSRTYGQSYNYNNDDQNKILGHSSNSLYEESRNVLSSYRMNSGVSKEVIGGGNDQYLNKDGLFQDNQSNYIIGENGLHRQGQYYVNRSYIGMVKSQVSRYSQPNEKSDEAGKDRELLEELDSFSKDRNLKEAVEILGLLEQHNVSVDLPRYLFLMNECGESQALQEAKHVHDHLTRSIPHPDVYIHNKILEMYSKCGSMEDAYEVFNEMPKRNLTSWDTMITWLAKNGHGEDAIDMFTKFKRAGLKPDNQMFQGVFTACSVVGDMKEGLLHFESMIKNYNLVPSMDNYVSVVDMLGSSGYLNEALEFIEKMPIKPSVEIWEIMMNQSRVHGDLQLADRCAELLELLDPSCLDKLSDIAKENEIKWSPRVEPLIISTKFFKSKYRDTSDPDLEKLYGQLRCLEQPMKEVGYVPETRVVLHDVDQESKEEALLSHSKILALSQALLSSPARAPIRILDDRRVCPDCHNALKIISKLVGRVIIARDNKRFHHFRNGVCACGDYW